MESEQTEQLEIKMIEKYKNEASITEQHIHIYSNMTGPYYEMTTGTQTNVVSIHLMNPHDVPIFLQLITIEQVSQPATEDQTESSLPSSTDMLYDENFQPGFSMWEHAIINQNAGQGEAKEKTIGHIPSVSLQPYTQYILSMQVKVLADASSPVMVTMGIFNSNAPHTLLEQRDYTDISTEWKSIHFTYRTTQSNQSFDRIFLQSDQPFAFTNISCQEVPKVFHENFQQPSTQWNHLQTGFLQGKTAGYMTSNQQVFASLQEIPFQEKESYVATAYVANPTQDMLSATCYIEFKNTDTGVFIRKPVSISTYSTTWEKIELPFTIPEAPWQISSIGFTYQGNQRLWFTELSIESNSIHTTHHSNSFESHPKWNSTAETHSDTRDLSTSESNSTEFVQAAVSETIEPSMEQQEDLSSTPSAHLQAPWITYHQEQYTYYQNRLIQTPELPKIEQYMNQKYTQQLSLSSDIKLINLSTLQDLNAVPDAYRIDYCFQQFTPENYYPIQTHIDSIQTHIQCFFQTIQHILSHMHLDGAFVFTAKDTNLPPVSYQNNQITIQSHPTAPLQNNSFLTQLYEMYCSSIYSFQHIDPLQHNVLYGLGLKWYEKMKQMYGSQPNLLSHLYQQDTRIWQELFDVSFPTEEQYYATLFQIMYSPIFMYVPLALAQQFSSQTQEYFPFKNSIECMQHAMQEQTENKSNE